MSERNDFFIIGIGASAGGLEALQLFFSKLPDQNPAAFVVIQHLSPDFKSMMDEILAKYTRMSVKKVTRPTKVKPNHVYLMSPKQNLELMGDTLMPRAHRAEDRPNMPIDMFFSSLGKHWGANTVGIILSGTGTDGSRGIKTIKEQGGIVMVQEPDSAKFDGMPNATLLTGLADFELRLPEMAQEVERIIHFIPRVTTEAKKLPSSEKDYLDEILQLVANETRINFALYKEATILRRMLKRMQIINIETLKNYHEVLMGNPQEIKQLSNEFLIGVSSFFRNKATWDAFRDKSLPEIVSQKETGDTIRVWVAGCATGEEAYTIGMIIDDYLAKHDLKLTYKIFGSDVDKRSIYSAGMGVYSNAIANAVPAEYLENYFDKKGNTYKVKKSFRDCFIFAAQNIISDPPFIRMDVVTCRNVLIYLNADVQQKVLSNFHFSLNSGGYLILGKSENIGSLGVFFTPLGEKTNIFQNRISYNRKLHQTYLPKISINTPNLPNVPSRSTSTLNPGFLNSLIAKAYDEDGVIVNSNYQILHIKGNLDRYFFFPKNDLTLYLEDVLDKDEYWLLKDGILAALKHEKAIYYDDVIFKKGRTKILLDLRFKAIHTEPNSLKLVYIEFRNDREAHTELQSTVKDISPDNQKRLSLMEKELEEKQRTIQLLREELDTSSEELQTSGEELLASNEELQSSNEELQSVNEEIYSVNAELQEKVKEVTYINNDLVNVLNSTEIAMIFVDHDFTIRRLTPRTSEIVNITHKDIGRSIDHFTTNLENVPLITLAQQVINTAQPLEREVSLKTGKACYLMKILPYRKADSTIEGVVITFVDITEVKEAQINVQNARTFAENIVKSVTDPLIVLDEDLRVLSANPAFYSLFKTDSDETEGHLFYEVDDGQWDDPELRNLLDNVIPENSIVTDYRLTRDFKRIGYRVLLLSAVTIPQTGPIPNLILLTIHDITEKEQARKQMIETAKRLNLVIQTSKIGTWEYDIHTHKVIADRRLRELFDLEQEGELTFDEFAHRLHKEDYPRVYRALREAVEQGKAYSADFKIVTKDGETRYLTGHGSMLMTDKGEPYKMLGINMDITERRRAEENIAHYGRLLEESYNEIFICDVETLHFINVNQGAQKNLGYTMEEMTALTPMDIKPEYDRDRYIKLIEPLRQGKEEVIRFETVHQRKDRTLYNVLVSLQLSVFHDMEVLIAIIVDNTETIEARNQLRLNEERLAFAINGTSDGIWDWIDITKEDIWWSPRLYELLGLDENEVQSTLSFYQSLIHPNDISIRHRAFQEHLQTNKPFDITVRMKHKTKGYRWYRSRGRVIRDPDGKPVRMAGVVSDIHNQKMAENKLKRTNRDLRIANEYLDNFVFTAAHDLRAPVANLKSLAGLLQSQNGQDNRVIEKIDLSIDRLEKTLRGLIKILDIQQADRKEHTSLNFKKVLQKVLGDLEGQIKEVQAEISYTFDVKTIQYVEPFLTSIFRNLLSNSLKFVQEGHAPKIHIHTKAEKSYVCLSVKDQGVGMDLERTRRKLFKPFERLSRSGNGLGIGLHIVKTIVEKNDGFVEVQSQVDEGTTFLVYLKPYSNEEENITH